MKGKTADSNVHTVYYMGIDQYKETFCLVVIRAIGVIRTVEYTAMRKNESDFNHEVIRCQIKYNIFFKNIFKETE